MGYGLKTFVCVCVCVYRACLWACGPVSLFRFEVFVDLLRSVNTVLELIASDVELLMLLRSGNSVFCKFWK